MNDLWLQILQESFSTMRMQDVINYVRSGCVTHLSSSIHSIGQKQKKAMKGFRMKMNLLLYD